MGNEGPIFQILLEVDVTRNSSRREQGNDLVKSKLWSEELWNKIDKVLVDKRKQCQCTYC